MSVKTKRLTLIFLKIKHRDLKSWFNTCFYSPQWFSINFPPSLDLFRETHKTEVCNFNFIKSSWLLRHRDRHWNTFWLGPPLSKHVTIHNSILYGAPTQASCAVSSWSGSWAFNVCPCCFWLTFSSVYCGLLQLCLWTLGSQIQPRPRLGSAQAWLWTSLGPVQRPTLVSWPSTA